MRRYGCTLRYGRPWSSILSLWILPIMKGGLVAHQWALRMHGFEAAQRSGSAIGKSDSK
jgi:hypothetical protein